MFLLFFIFYFFAVSAIAGPAKPIVVNNFIVNDASFFQQLQGYMAFGKLKNKPLNVLKLNQGLWQFNRLVSNNAKIKIQPIDSDKYDIHIKNQTQNKLRLAIGGDNLGSEFSGKNRQNIRLASDNILNLGDAINLQYFGNSFFDKKNKRANSIQANINLPLIINNIDYSYIYSDFSGKDRNNIFSGHNSINQFFLNTTIITQKLSLQNGIILKKSQNYFNNIKLDNAKHKLSIINSALLLNLALNNNYWHLFWRLHPSINIGISSFGANKDSKQARDQPHNQFKSLKINSFIEHKYQHFSLANELEWQSSSQPLLASEQINIGGYNTVRGFSEGSISGDSGYFMRNKITSNLKKTSLQTNIGIDLFYDYGKTNNNKQPKPNSGRLSGAGIKSTVEIADFAISATYAKALSRSQLLNKKENSSLYFELSYSFAYL
jgi:hemolysin activation/secretion protein